MNYQKISSEIQLERQSKILQEWLIPLSQLPKNVIEVPSKYLSSKELLITTTPTVDLLHQVHSGQWSSHEVVQAFCHRSAIAHQLTNCCSEILFDQALKQAKAYDHHLETTGELKGPLHGLPISLKDEFDLKGVKTTLALISRANCPPSKQTSPNIQILLDAGAIPITKTTVPVGAFSIETSSNLFGYTVNPYNRSLSSGGSSGGESALLALRGSSLGIGTDLGGSIRQPSSQTGLYGMRISTGRTPHCCQHSMVLGGESIKGTNGPMANDIDSIEVYCKLMAEEGWKYDLNVVNKPWKPVQQDSFKFGFVLQAGSVKLDPPVKRAIYDLKAKLEANGAECVEIDGSIIEGIAKFASFMSSNGNKRILEEVSKSDEPLKSLEAFKSANDLQVSELWELQHQRTALANKFWRLWQQESLDGLIMPVSPHAGFKFGEFRDVCYSPFANIVDFPSCTFPSLYSDASIDRDIAGNYDRFESHGVPVGLQVLGPRLEEERVISMVRYLEGFTQWN
jgi:amidase